MSSSGLRASGLGAALELERVSVERSCVAGFKGRGITIGLLPATFDKTLQMNIMLYEKATHVFSCLCQSHALWRIVTPVCTVLKHKGTEAEEY